MNYFKRNEIYLFDHFHAACVKLNGIKEEHAHRIPKSDLKIRFPKSLPHRGANRMETLLGTRLQVIMQRTFLSMIIYISNKPQYPTKRKDIKDCTITWLLCAFSLVVHRDLLENIHTDDVKSTPYHVSGIVSIFSCPKNSSINHLNFYCIKQIYNIFPCVCTLINHRRCHSVERTTITPLDFVSYFLSFYTLWHLLWSITVHTAGKCNLFVKL